LLVLQYTTTVKLHVTTDELTMVELKAVELTSIKLYVTYYISCDNITSVAKEMCETKPVLMIFIKVNFYKILQKSSIYCRNIFIRLNSLQIFITKSQ